MSVKDLRRASIQSSISKSVWLPLIVLVIGYLYATEVGKSYEAQRGQLITDALERRLAQISEAVNDRVSLYAYGLSSLKASIVAVGIDNLHYDYVQTYAKSQNYSQQYPGARGFGFIRRVEVTDFAEFMAMARLDRPDKQFELRTLTPHSNSYFIIQYIMPEHANLQAIGLDIGSETMRRRSAEKAAISNSTQLTAPITLVQANKKRLQGFLIMQPVYDTLKVPEGDDARMEALVGWSYAPLLIDEVLSSVSGLRDDVMLTIDDISAGDALTFFGRHQDGSLDALKIQQTLQLFGRDWRLSLTPNQAFIDGLRLPSRQQAFNNTLAIVTSLALVIFSLHIVISRRADAKRYERELAEANQRALELNNEKLEGEVAARTYEIAQANILQRRILESAGYALIATDNEGLITAFNPAAEKLIGYRTEEMVGKQTPAVFHLYEEMEARAAELSEELGRPVEPGFDVFVEKVIDGDTDINNWTYVRKDGSRVPVRLSATSLFDEDGKIFGFLGIAYDLTPQLKREQELKEARLQAEQANEAKSSFLANMSHEIRTPLNGIYGALQLIRRSDAGEQHGGLLDKAIYSTRNLSRIINDILDFSKIEAGKISIDPHRFSLSTMLDGLQSDMSMLAGNKPVALIFENQANHDVWIGDAVRIRQVLLNIGTNAIKFTEQGKVTISARDTASDEVLFSITDTGQGMSKDALARLFDRFEQADSSTTRKYGGTGLGMAITQSLVHLMHGKIRVVSTPGEGSRFIVTLPVIKAAGDVHDATPDTNDKEPDLSHAMILVAEDNEINRSVMEAMLADTRATLYFAENGLEAVEFVNKKCPDLVLMDIQMPVMDGVEACKKIKQCYPQLPVIAVTANAMAADTALYNQVGFDSYLSKPVDIGQFNTVLAQYLTVETE